MIELAAIGGYNEAGKNMTAIKYNDEVVICDMGLFLPRILDFEEEGGHREDLTDAQLIKIGAIPDDRVIEKWRDYVKVIVLGHCHLDHLGAAQYLAQRYDAPLVGTPYTMNVLKKMFFDDKVNIPNRFVPLNVNSKYKVSENIEIEFINMTHSTLQTVMTAIHTPDGTIIYANDFKFDNHPVIGLKPNYHVLEKIGEKNALALVVDSLYSNTERKTPSEKVAREMLKDVLLGTSNFGKLVIVTTFASHIARLQSVIDFGKEMDRKIIFLGRSLSKYVGAAERAGLVNFSADVEIVPYAGMINKKLAKVEKERGKYLIVCTGNQGEPKSVLSRMARGEFDFKLVEGDHVVFSCNVIPVEENISNRDKLEKLLNKARVRIFTGIHQSGHASREDLRDLVNMIKPKYIIPAHGEHEKLNSMAELAKEEGYKLNKNVLVLNDGDIVKLDGSKLEN